MAELTWKRTGKITMRSDCGMYLVIRYPTHYNALHGPQCSRLTLGHYPDKDQAVAACNSHATGEKNPVAP
jgi:hypothetical protein